MHTDANEIAALLEEILGPGATSVVRRCQSCRERGALGEHLLFRGAGLVVRCPRCGDVAMKVALREERWTVEWRGSYEL